jgi:hypothetical protein
MARTRKSIQPLNLYKYDVLIEDKATRSDYFKVTQFDGNFYGGRNAFLLAGSGTLRPNSKIFVEILNKDGTTVYSAPITSFIEGSSRLIQIEVYSDTPIGPGKLVLLGCADTYLDGTPVPTEWEGKYNVRWTTDVVISPRIENKTPIRFEVTPSMVATEKFYYAPSSSFASQQFRIPIDVEISPKYYNVFPNGYLAKIRGIGEYQSEYLGGFITGTIAFSNGTVSETASVNIPITKIYNSNLAESQGALIYTNNNILVLDAFLSSSGVYSASFQQFGSVIVSSSIGIEYSKLITVDTGSNISFSKLRLVDLKTISGEIHRIRLSYKPSTEPGEFVLLGDIDTAVSELLTIDSGSRIVKTGTFADIQLTDYWYSETMSLQRNANNPTIPNYYTSSSLSSSYLPTVQSSTVLLNSITATPQIVSGSYISGSSYFIGTKNTNTLQLFPRVEYTIAFDAIVSNTSASIELNQSDYSLEVYLVNEGGLTGKLLAPDARGQLLGTLTPTSTFQQQNFENTEFNFIPKTITVGNFGLRFVSYGGFWNIANVSVKPAQEPFFSPDEVDILIPNVNYTDSVVTFRAQYLDVNNNSIGLSTFSPPTYFTGSTSIQTAEYIPSIPSSKPTFVIDGGEWIVRDLTSPANYNITINSGSGVINNTRISWPQTAITTAATNSIVFATPTGTISSSVTFGSYISESLDKLVLHRTYVDTATYGTRIYAVAESRTFNRSTPVGEFNQYRLLDYVVTSSAWSGSVALTPTRANVNFYFANLALLQFVKDEPAIVRGHLDRQIEKFYNNARTDTSASIYASWQQIHGTTYGAFYKWPYDIINPEGIVTASRADSHDSYAATFVLLAHKYATEASGGLAWWDTNYSSIYNAAYWNMIFPTVFIGSGYLTKTFQDINVYPYYQTFDNMEVYAALKNLFPLMRSRGGTQATDANSQGSAETNILNGIRDAWSGSNSTGYARYTYSGSAWLPSSLQTFYPEVSIQSGYSLYNIPEAIATLSTDRGARLSRVNDLLLNTAPNWYTTRQYDVFPNGYAAASLVASGHTDIANDYLKFVSTHIAYDSPGRYYINEVGWVKYIQNKLNTNDLTGGTANYIPLWTSATLQSSSNMYQSASNIGVGITNPSASLHISGTMAVQSIFEKVSVTASAAPATLNYNVLDQAILFHSASSTTNWTLNFRGNASTTLNSIMYTGQSLTTTLMVLNTTTAYSASAYQIDGTTIRPRWQGGTSGSANTNSLDAHTFTIIKTSPTPTYVLLGSITRYT